MTAITKRPDGKYVARPTIDGRMEFILRDTKTAVEREMAQRKEKARRRRLGLPDPDERPEDVTFDALCERFLAQYAYSPRSKQTLIERLAPARKSFGRSLIRDLTPESIGAWYANLTQGATTKDGYKRAVKQVLGWAVTANLLRENPARGVKTPGPAKRRIKPFVSWAQVILVASKAGKVYGPLIRFACATGLRPQEWAALEWRHIDLARRELRVEQTVRSGKIEQATKTEGSERIVQLSQAALDALGELARPINGGLVFPAPGGGLINPSNFRKRVWKKALADAKVEYRALDQMRHSFATLALAAGGDIAWISAQLGHSKIQTTLTHYARWLPSANERNLALLDADYATTSALSLHSEEAASDA